MAKNTVRDQWIVRMTESMCLAHPDVSREDITRIVEKTYAERIKDTEVKLYNSYENSVAETTLLGIVDWIDTTKPLIAESGVFFYPKHRKRNVNIEIIKECMLDARTIHKKEKFKAMEAGDTFLAAVKDIQQSNDKKAANSGYGAEGQSSSFLYNLHSAMSVTASGRGQLSTACQCFENLLADNVLFFDMTEFYTFVYNVTHEKPEWEYETFSVCPFVPTEEEFVTRFVNKFGHYTLANEERIRTVYHSLDDEMKVRVFYKANMADFLMLRVPSDIYSEIAHSDVEFIDPNEIPDEIRKPVKELTKLVMEFVLYKYGIFRYEDRARYQKRKVAIVMDTDSNFIAYGTMLNHVMSNVVTGKMFKKKSDYESYKMRVLNVLSDFTTQAITKTLYHYLGKANVAEEDRKYIKMKNEFYYSRVVVTYAKKSYIGLQKRQEQVVFKKPKLDVKGVNFFKSTASEDTSAFIYDKVLMGELLTPADGEISLRRTYKTIYDFQQKMYEEIKSGSLGYLKRSIRVKSADAYANPLRIGQYKAVYVWNKVNKDKDRIDLPATVTLVKVKLNNKQDVAKLEQWPDIYRKMLELFDTDTEIGDYVDEDGKVKKGKGIKSIAMPEELEVVPDWLLTIIDVDTLVADNMSLFAQLMKPLGLTTGGVKLSNGAARYYTNLVRI